MTSIAVKIVLGLVGMAVLSGAVWFLIIKPQREIARLELVNAQQAETIKKQEELQRQVKAVHDDVRAIRENTDAQIESLREAVGELSELAKRDPKAAATRLRRVVGDVQRRLREQTFPSRVKTAPSVPVRPAPSSP